jgi:aminobenzoyl-glutamate utilization protein B
LYTLKESFFEKRKGTFVMTTTSYDAIDQAVEQVIPTIERIANEVWQLSELSLHEVKSAQLIMDILQEHGFIITSKGTAGVPTAFIAEYGSGTPILGLLAEYDALPGLGNEPVPHREPRKDRVSSGHGCAAEETEGAKVYMAREGYLPPG